MPPTNRATTVRQASLGSLGNYLALKRQERGMSITRLAELTGLNLSYLWQLEHGRFQDMGLEKFCRIMDALGMSADQMLLDSGYLAQPTSTLRTMEGRP